MIVACFIIAHALYAQGAVPAQIQIRNMRASRVLELMSKPNPMSHSISGIEADDTKGTLSVKGSATRVNEVRSIVKLIDLPRQRISVHVSVESVADKVSYEVTAKIWNLQKWKTGDGDTGITVAIEPRLSDSNTVTLMVVCGRDDANTLQETFRMKLGTSRTITMGSHMSTFVNKKADGSFDYKYLITPEPKITIRVDR